MVNEKQKKAIQDCVCTYFGCCRPEMASFASKTSHCGLGAARANVTGKFSKGGKENKKTIKSLIYHKNFKLKPTAYRGAVYCEHGDVQKGRPQTKRFYSLAPTRVANSESLASERDS